MAQDLDKQGQVPRILVNRGPTLGGFYEPVNMAFINIADYFTSHPSIPGDNVGITDCAPALNEALAALALQGSGVIYFPPGRYKFLSPVSYNLPVGLASITITGAGQDITTLFWPSVGGLTFNYAGAGSSVHIRDLSLTTGVTNGGNAIALANAVANANPSNTAISDIYCVTIRGDDGYSVVDYWSNGVAVSNVSNVQFENLTVAGAAAPNGNGISLLGLPGSSTFGVQYNVAKSTFLNLSVGIVYGSFVQGVSVDQCNFVSNNGGVHGISSPVAQTGALSQLAVTNSEFNVPGNAVNLSTGISGVLLSNNLVISRASSGGFGLLNGSNFTVSGNVLVATSATGTTGIALGAATSLSSITGNVIFGYGTGILLLANAASAVISSNLLNSNTAAITNSSNAVTNAISGNLGYNPVGPLAISVTASPFTYTAGASPETVYAFSGTVSAVNFDKNGGALTAVAATASPFVVDLGPFEQIKVTYSVAPSMNKMVH
jgi:hypothetical protein